MQEQEFQIAEGTLPAAKVQLAAVRVAALNHMLGMIGLLGGLVILNAERNLFLEGRYALALFYLIAFGCCVLFLCLTKLPYAVRTGVPILIIYIVGTMEFWLSQFNSLGLLYYLALVVITGALLGVRAGYGALGLCVASILFLGFLADFAPFGIAPPAPDPRFAKLTWRAATLNFMMLAVVALALHMQLLQGLQASISASRDYLAKLQREAAERQRAEGELQEVRDLLHAAVSQSHAGIMIADAPGVTIRMANQAALDVRGGDPGALVGIGLEQLSERWRTFHPDGTAYAPRDLPLARAVLKGETVQDEEVVVLDEEGVERTAMVNATPIRNAAGAVIAGVVVFQDVTERKRGLEALRESEARYRAVFEQANDGILVYRDGVVTECNQRAVEMSRMARNELIGSTAGDLSPEFQPDGRPSRELSEAIIERSMQGTHQVFEWTHRRGDGTPLEVEVSISCVDTSGEPFLLALWRDISERKGLERELHERDVRLRGIVEASRDWIWSIDLNGRHTYCNPAVRDILGYEPEELVSASAFDFIHEDDRGVVEQVFPRAVEERNGWANLLLRWRHKDGSLRYLESNAVAIVGAGGNLEGFQGVDRDVSERLEAERALRASEQRYRSVVENQTEFVVRWHPGGTILFVNEAYARYCGGTCDTIAGTNTMEMLSAEERERVMARLHGLTPEQPVAAGEIRVIRADGSTAWNHWTDRAIFDDSGRIREIQSIGRDITKRVNAELALRESEERSRALLEASPTGILAYQDGIVAFVNPAGARMFGFDKPGDVVGRPVVDLIAEEFREQHRARAARIARGQSNPDVEMRYRRPDGEDRIIRVSSVPFTLQSRPAALVISTDDTERKRTEEALRESEQRYRSLFEAASDSIFLMKGEHFVDCNPKTLEMFACTRDDIIGMPPYRFSPVSQPDGRPSKEAAIEKIGRALDGESQFFEWRHCQLGGAVFEAEVSLSRMFLGPEPYILAIVRDVTERKRTEEALRRSEMRNSAVLEVLPDIMFCLDRNGVHLDYHVPPNEKLFVPVDQIIGRTVAELLPPEVADIYARHLARAIDGKGMEVFEYELTFSETDVRTYEARMVPQDFDVVLSIVRNVTDRKQAEERLARYRDQLEDLVRERTQALELAQAELVRKERLAALGTLTATVAHEIRNPLGTVRNAVFSIGDALARDETGRAARALDLAEKNIRRCDGIITELLDFTRKRQLTRRTTNMDVWLGEILNEQRIPEGIVFSTALASGARLSVDPEHLRRAVICVLNNAVQAIQGGQAAPGRLVVGTRLARSRFEMRFEDNGPGIPESVRARMFEPLFSTKSFGVGLGVPIALDIMSDHGGGLEYESEEGAGTTAILWLPALEDDA